MSRSLAFLPVVLVAVLVAVPSPPPVQGCAVIPRPGTSIDIQSENALIVYDSATKTEHFIRTASFSTSSFGNSTSADFGFMVPTPSKPELAEASPDVFPALADLTKQRTVTQRRMKDPYFSCALLPESRVDFKTVGAAFPAPKSAVNVVEQKRVGAYDAAVLQADDPKALREWLTENKYEARPQLDEWFKPYIANKWFLVAFKIATGDTGGKTVQNTAVRISFQTDTPFYPYREPEDARAETVHKPSRSLRLFVLSDSRVSGTVGKADEITPFPGITRWANQLDAGQVAKVATAGKLPESVGARNWHLTEIDDPSSPRAGFDELYLTPSADQSAVERPPHVNYEYYDPWPWVWMAVFAFGVAFVAQMIWRSVRKKPPTDSAKV